MVAGDLLSSFPFMTFFPAVAIATYMGDRRAGWIATGASLVVVRYFLLAPLHSLRIADVHDSVSLVVFLAIAAVVVETTAWLNRSADAAHRIAEENHRLFLELKHRVANNLQMVASLLVLHQTQVADESAGRVIASAIERLRLLGDLHRHIYQPGSTKVEIRRFLPEICEILQASLGQNPVVCEVDADRSFPADHIVPLGMILHELVANALEHGAASVPDGAVKVSFLAAAGGGNLLTVADNGRGMPASFDPDRSNRLGMKLVKSFAGQLRATLDWSSPPSGGTVVTLRLPPPSSLS
jgi:two-component sensor histidine kinase